MNIEKITWPTASMTTRHFIISVIGIVFLVIFFIFADTIVSWVLENIISLAEKI